MFPRFDKKLGRTYESKGDRLKTLFSEMKDGQGTDQPTGSPESTVGTPARVAKLVKLLILPHDPPTIE